MKTTFKKVFDEFDDTLVNIDDNSFSDIDIDIDKIKGDVFMRIKDNDHKKKFSNKLTVLLIAAVILIAGTVGAFASGNVRDVFSGIFNIGSNVNDLGLYEAGNVVVSSNDELDVNVLGITGDGERVYAAIEVTKKDGSAVIDENYTHIIDHCGNTVTGNCVSVNGESRVLDPRDFTCRLSNNNRVLTVYSHLYSAGDLQDGRMTVTVDHLVTCRIDQVLATIDVNKAWNDVYELGPESVCFDDAELERKRNELGLTAEECIQIECEGKREYCQGEQKHFSLPAEISFDLNYKTDGFIEKKLSTKTAPNVLKPYAEKAKMSVTPFGVYLTAQCDDTYVTDPEAYNPCFKGIGWDDTSKISLTDGTVYYLYVYPIGTYTTEEDGVYYDKYTLNISTVPGAPFTGAQNNVLDTREIESVMINGDVVYSK